MSPAFASDPTLPSYGSILSAEHATPFSYGSQTPNDSRARPSYYEGGSFVTSSSAFPQTNTDFDTSSQDMDTSNAYAGYRDPTGSPLLYDTANWNVAGISSWSPASQSPGSMPQFAEYYDMDELAEVATDMDGLSQPVQYGDGTTDRATDGILERVLNGSVMTATEAKKQSKRNRRRSSASAKAKPILDGNGHHRPTTQLRTAQRSAKHSSSSRKPAESPEERNARAMHNQVEQQYRKRLNAQFERLLAALPPDDYLGPESGGATAGASPGSGVLDEDKRVSKAEVLDKARQRIKTLEKERASLERQKRELVGSLGRLKEEWGQMMGPGGPATA